MMNARNPVSPRGLVLLAATAVVGVVLAVHGWSAHDRSKLPGPLAGSGSSSPAAGPRSTARHATAGPPVPSASASPSAGPLLSTQSFASYAFRVWPGVPSASAKAAMTGLSISVHRHGAGLMVAGGVTGQPAQAPKFYPAGAQVYVIEASMGDDSGGSDYNLGDDGLIVTDARGRIVQ
jgi:hypothetical protein